MRPFSMFVLGATACATAFLACAPNAFALHRHYYRHPVTVYSSDEPPLTVNKRSWLDPGNQVPAGAEQNYVTASTGFNETPDEAYFPSRFHEDSLPRPLYPTGEPRPVVYFWTPGKEVPPYP